MNDKDYMKEDWFAVLKEEVEKNGTAKTAARLRYAVARSLVSVKRQEVETEAERGQQ